MTGASQFDGRLLVPLYVHPAVDPAAWQAVAAADPGRIAAVVLNLADGPGDIPDNVFAEAADELRKAGLPLLGYADTDYGRRPHAAVVDDILTYRQRHGITGVYLDQVATHPGALAHYRRLATAPAPPAAPPWCSATATTPIPATPRSASPTCWSPSRATGRPTAR